MNIKYNIIIITIISSMYAVLATADSNLSKTYDHLSHFKDMKRLTSITIMSRPHLTYELQNNKTAEHIYIDKLKEYSILRWKMHFPHIPYSPNENASYGKDVSLYITLDTSEYNDRSLSAYYLECELVLKGFPLAIKDHRLGISKIVV